MNKLFFIAGLPRSGKTLLGEILNQNANMFGLLHSPLCEMLWRQYDLWKDKNEFTQYDFKDPRVQKIKSKYLKNFIFDFYKNFTAKKIIFDVKLSWNNHPNIEMHREIFNKKPKIVCCVRNIEDIMASFYLHFDKQKRFWDLEPLKENFFSDYWNLRESYLSKYQNCLLLVEYNKLVTEPNETLKKVYEFIEEPVFKHSFNNLKKSKTDPVKILTKKQLAYYTKMSFWRGHKYR